MAVLRMHQSNRPTRSRRKRLNPHSSAMVPARNRPVKQVAKPLAAGQGAEGCGQEHDDVLHLLPLAV